MLAVLRLRLMFHICKHATLSSVTFHRFSQTFTPIDWHIKALLYVLRDKT